MTSHQSPDDPSEPSSFPEAQVRKRYFSAIWLVPIIAALMAGYLGIRSYTQRGPEIVLTFQSGDGLTAGQTPVKYKAVAVGVVDNISLSKDKSGVTVSIRMTSAAESMLTEDAKFWVVRPRLNSANISSLSTLVSGTFIQVEPGRADGDKVTHYKGLENPPVIQSEEPGTMFILKTERLGSVTAGTPVFYRDMNAGEVLGYDMGDGYGPISVNVLIRSPYDEFVKPSSHFWNASGISVKTRDGGVHVELQSIQSVLQGGIAFATAPDAKSVPKASAKETFKLYENYKVAQTADSVKPLSYVTYMQSDVKDLTAGSPVRVFGLRVGSVSDVKLVFDKDKGEAKVRVAFDVQPDLAFGGADPSTDFEGISHQLVQNGMRARLESSDLVLGQEILSLEFVPASQKNPDKAVQVAMEGDAFLIPSQVGGMDHLTEALGDIAGKLNSIPFDQIGDHLNHLSAAADQMLAGPEMQQAIHSLAATMTNAEDITKKANTNLTPALQRLPAISQQLQDAVAHANEFMTSVNAGYGDNSDFQHSTERVLSEVNDAARSIKLLADFLERHPEALIQGKSGERSK